MDQVNPLTRGNPYDSPHYIWLKVNRKDLPMLADAMTGHLKGTRRGLGASFIRTRRQVMELAKELGWERTP